MVCMKRSLGSLLCVFFLNAAVFAQEKAEYSAALIPDSLKKNANTIVRHEVVETSVGKSGSVTMKTRKVVTALTEKGIDDLHFADYEDKFRKLEFAEVRVFDAAGNQLKRYKKKEMEKMSGNDGISMVVDDKVYFLNIPSFSVPFTVEYITEISLSGFIDLNDFYTSSYEEAIQSSTLTVTSTADNKLRYKNLNTNIKPVITEDKDKITWQWQIANVKAIEYEPGSPRRSLPRVLITPTYFEMDNYPGEFINWQRFGLWYNKLSAGAGNLSQEKFMFFRDMVKDIPDTIMKIKKLYRYLQENYRYVSVQLGIGGFKTFDAVYVDKNKFGDCKALSNFMQTILNAAGIKSYSALINAGYDESPVDADFANYSFNHVILCVPSQKDSIWLECTSRVAPFGKLGSFTENRYALLITENGGKLVPTPASRATDNIFNGNNQVILEADGSAKATVSIQHKGAIHDMFKLRLWEQPEHRQKEYLMRGQGFKDFDEMTLEKITGEDGGTSKLNLHFEKIPDFSAGSKHFLSPHLYSVWSTSLPEEKTKRTKDYVFEDAFIESDTTTWQLPEGYIAENIPASASFSIDLASFDARYTYDETKKTITAFCRLELKKSRVPAARYSEARIFFQRVLKELEQKIIVKRG